MNIHVPTTVRIMVTRMAPRTKLGKVVLLGVQ